MSNEVLFALGERVFAPLHGVFQPAMVEHMEKRAVGDANGGRETFQWLYGLHWIGYDRRYDDFLSHELIQKIPTTKKKGVSVATKGGSSSALLPMDSLASHTVSAGIGANQLNSHPGATRGRESSEFFGRPKVIKNIIMGEFDVEVWYFSPYHLARAAVRLGLRRCALLPTSSDAGSYNLHPDALGRASGGGCCSPTPSGGASLQPNAQIYIRGSPIDDPAFRSTSTSPPPTSPTASSFLTSGELSLYRLSSLTDVTLHICPFCVAPFLCRADTIRHLHTVCARRPPGTEVYRDPNRNILVFEIDGQEERVFAENLGLLCKLFLEHKTLDYDTGPFIYYVLCSVGTHGCEVKGYFSKEKTPLGNYNLSCILTLPQFQNQGIGTFLIALSYELSKREGKVGGPERPLSDLGERSYVSYWSNAIEGILASQDREASSITLEEISRQTSMEISDIECVLPKMNLLRRASGASGSSGDLLPAVGKYEFRLSGMQIQKALEKRMQQFRNPSLIVFYRNFLQWHPAARQWSTRSDPEFIPRHRVALLSPMGLGQEPLHSGAAKKLRSE